MYFSLLFVFLPTISPAICFLTSIFLICGFHLSLVNLLFLYHFPSELYHNYNSQMSGFLCLFYQIQLGSASFEYYIYSCLTVTSIAGFEMSSFYLYIIGCSPMHWPVLRKKVKRPWSIRSNYQILRSLSFTCPSAYLSVCVLC